MRMPWLICLLALTTALTTASISKANAQQAVKIVGQLREQGADDPSFDGPRVDIYILTENVEHPTEEFILDEDEGELDGEYRFEERFGVDKVKNNYVMVVGRANGYMPVRPDGKVGNRIRRINSDALKPEIDMPVDLKKRSYLAEVYRVEVNQILRQSNRSPEVYERAANAAASAVSTDPKLDNFLLAVKVTGNALKQGQTFNGLLTTREDIQALGGFDQLDQEERWRVQLELLESFLDADDLEMPVNRTNTVATLAAQLGDDMLQRLDFQDEAQTKLPVTRVFASLSILYVQLGDCQSLIDNNELGLINAEKLQSNWRSQRVLYLSWADCLEKMSGIGQVSRSNTEYIQETGKSAFLKAQWARFSKATERVQELLAFATSGSDARLKDLIKTADAIAAVQE
ncbi:MAG: hypothetical protein ABJG55_12665 [Paracoccaceae bacterium]